MNRYFISTRTLLASIAASFLVVSCGGEEPSQSKDAAAQKTEQAPPASDPIAEGVEAMTEAAYRRHVETLASDEFGGRAPATTRLPRGER